jgi:O-antigen/teichoic acid export membrane protein
MKRFSRLFYSLGLEKGLAFITIGNLVSTVLGVFLWLVLASHISANAYGSLNYYISVTIISASLGIMGFDTTLTTFVAKGLTKMIAESGMLVLIAGIVLSVTLLLIFRSIPLVAAFLTLLFFTFSISEMLGKRMYKGFMVSLIIQRVIALVSVPLLFSIYGVDGALYGYTISYLPFCYRYIISLRRIEFSSSAMSTLRPIKNFFFHSFALGVFKHLIYFSDKLIIMPLFGAISLGYYQFGIQVLTTLLIIPIILTNYLLPQEAANKNTNGRKVETLGIFLSVMLTILLITLVPAIIVNMFPRFENAILSTQIILTAEIPLTIISIFNSLFMAREQSFHVFVGSGIFLVTQYLSIYILGSLYGLVGLSISTVAASVIQAMYLVVIRRKFLVHRSEIT